MPFFSIVFSSIVFGICVIYAKHNRAIQGRYFSKWNEARLDNSKSHNKSHNKQANLDEYIANVLKMKTKRKTDVRSHPTHNVIDRKRFEGVDSQWLAGHDCFRNHLHRFRQDSQTARIARIQRKTWRMLYVTGNIFCMVYFK